MNCCRANFKEFKIQMSGNTRTLTLALSLALATSTLALAQPAGGGAAAAASATSKVGVVGIQQAIANTNEGKKEFDAVQARFTPKQTELKALNDEVENLKKQLQAQGDKLSEEERATRVKALETKQKTLQRNFEDAQNEFQQAEQEVFNRLGGKMLTVLEKYASEHNYSLILDVSNQQATPVLWASQTTNITKELIDAYNAQGPAAAPAPKPAASGAAANKPAGAAANKPAGATGSTKP
jgi:outer membrane protein